MNDIGRHIAVFEGITPYEGTPPQGFYPDWTGALTHADFRAYQGMKADKVGGRFIKTRLPVVEDGEGWFEAVSQVEAAREARGHYVMITLGACYGAQAVGSCLTLKAVNPMPFKLVAVEPEPTNLTWVERHFRDNGIDPDQHWLVGSSVGATNEPTLFPVGAPGSGAQNTVSTNQRQSREIYAKVLTSTGERAKEALRSILLENRTGLRRDLLSGQESDERADAIGSAIFSLRNAKRRLRDMLKGQRRDKSKLQESPNYFMSDIVLLSTVTLKDILGPFDRVDYLEVDIQQSEIVVFPPFMDLVKRKVRRVHLGTHGRDVHRELAALFRRDGWEIVFDYEPNGDYVTPHGKFSLNDGVLTVLNPDLAPKP
jgi:hypothetical protein